KTNDSFAQYRTCVSTESESGPRDSTKNERARIKVVGVHETPRLCSAGFPGRYSLTTTRSLQFEFGESEINDLFSRFVCRCDWPHGKRNYFAYRKFASAASYDFAESR